MSNNKFSFQRYRRLILNLHLIIGLTTGIVVFIVSITGSLWIFQDEILDFYSDYKTVTVEKDSFILPTEAKEIAKEKYPNQKIHGVLFGNPNEAIEVILYTPEPLFYTSIFINPYSSEIIHIEDHLESIFTLILYGHTNLFIPSDIGPQIVKWSTVLFVMIICSGLFLWWPRNKKSKKEKYLFKWNNKTRTRRKLLDLHSIFGFYASILLIITAFTGLIMAFEDFREFAHSAAGGERKTSFETPKSNNILDSDRKLNQSIDLLYPKLKAEYPNAQNFEIHFPENKKSSIYVEITYDSGVFYSADYRFYDQATLNEVETPSIYGRYSDSNFADTIIRMNYDIHIGSILGISGKILLFFASLISASLPVTGTIMFLKRRTKLLK